MRRGLPDALRASPPEQPSSDSVLLDASLALDCITPVVGGGVRSYEPDTVDRVRIQGIRGQLRTFWRGIVPIQHVRTAEELFLLESSLWGGISGERPVRSRVQLWIENANQKPGRDVPAGYHPPRPNGSFGALPQWSGDRALGYALFPLQRPRKELDEAAARGAARCPTRSLREGQGFVLRIRLAPRPDQGANDAAQGDQSYTPSLSAEEDCRQLLAALWCWVHFGGIGARTTRGFGALAPRAEGLVIHRGEASVDRWKRLFQPPEASRLAAWLDAGLAAAQIDSSGSTDWPSLHGLSLLHGAPERSADAAHALVVAALQTFRQGERVGRNPGRSRGRPGESRWPEPHALRQLADEKLDLDDRHRWEHPPGHTRRRCAPRAAFGLPIEISFKDPGDRKANARLLPAQGGRWISPLRVRALRCSDGRFVPIVLALARRPGRDGNQVIVQFSHRNNGKPGQNNEKPVQADLPVRGTSGAASPIADYLAPDGDAVAAFLRWLQAAHRFSRVKESS